MLTYLLLPAALLFTVTAPTPAPRVFLYNANMHGTAHAPQRPPQRSPHRRHLCRRPCHQGRPILRDAKGHHAPQRRQARPYEAGPLFLCRPRQAQRHPLHSPRWRTQPELKKICDQNQFGCMVGDARTLALAFYLTGNQAYVDRAALLLRTWFLYPPTKMNPHLEFGQGFPGVNTGRGIGIIESRSLLAVTDAVGLLAGSKSWTPTDKDGMKTWLVAYLHWMQTSEKGRAEDAAKNNHGTCYDLQVVDLALFLGDRELAVDTLTRVKTSRIALPVEPDGRQPLELERINAWSYSNGNLDGLTQLAVLRDEVGVDLWNFRTADDRGIRARRRITPALRQRHQKVGL